MKMQEHSERVNRAIFHPDGTCIASGSDDRTIKIWDLRRKRLIQHYDAHGAAVLDLDFCHSQNFLASASADRSVKIWDLQEGGVLHVYNYEGASSLLRGFLQPPIHPYRRPSSGEYIHLLPSCEVYSPRTLRLSF